MLQFILIKRLKQSPIVFLATAVVLIHLCEERLQAQGLLSFHAGFQKAYVAVKTQDNSIIGPLYKKGKTGTKYRTTFQVLGMKTEVYISNNDLKPQVSFESSEMSSDQARSLFKNLKTEIISQLPDDYKTTQGSNIYYFFDGPVSIILTLLLPDSDDPPLSAFVTVDIS